jgi:hypothetical protein
MGATPPLRTPPGVEVVSFCTEVHRASFGGVDLYGVGTFNEQLIVEHHTQAAGPHQTIEIVHALLREIPSEHSWIAD